MQCPSFSRGPRSLPSRDNSSFSREAHSFQSHSPRSRPFDPAAEPTSLRFLGPFNGITRAAPCGVVRHHHSGSARRFSQPLSGFLADPRCATLFRAAAIPGTRPSEPSPRLDRAPLSGPLAPLRSSTGVLERSARTFRRPFHRRQRSRAVAWIPCRLWAPIRRAEARFPATLGDEPPEPLRSASLIRFEALFPSRVRSHRPGRSRDGGRCSPGLHASLALDRPRLGPSDPPEPEGSCMRCRPETPAHGSRDLATPRAG